MMWSPGDVQLAVGTQSGEVMVFRDLTNSGLAFNLFDESFREAWQSCRKRVHAVHQSASADN